MPKSNKFSITCEYGYKLSLEYGSNLNQMSTVDLFQSDETMDLFQSKYMRSKMSTVDLFQSDETMDLFQSKYMRSE